MALHWNWNEKVGKVYCRKVLNSKLMNDGYWANLYVGNAWLIEIWEEENQYQLSNFFADRDHLKNCIKDKCFKGYHAEYYIYTDSIDKLPKGFIELFVKGSKDLFTSCEIHFINRPITESGEGINNELYD